MSAVDIGGGLLATMEPERSQSEKKIETKMELLLFMATFSQRAVGYRIVKELKDANTITVHFNDGGPLQLIDLGTGDDYVLNIDTPKGKMVIEIKYSCFFSGVFLPSTEKFLDNDLDELSEIYLNYIMEQILIKTQDCNELVHGKGVGMADRDNSAEAQGYYDQKQLFNCTMTRWFCQKFIPQRITEEGSSSESEEEEEEEIEVVKPTKNQNGKSKKLKNNKKSSDKDKKTGEEIVEVGYDKGPLVYPEIPSGGRSGPLFGVEKGSPFGRSFYL